MGFERKFGPSAWSELTPVVKGLVTAMVVVWVLQQTPDGRGTGAQGDGGFLRTFGLWPAAVLHEGAVWQLFTHLFLHGPWWHILSNVICLLSLGPPLERSIGPVHFTLLFFFTGVAGGLSHVAAYAGQGWPAVGASGAIMGVFAALVALHRSSRFVIIFLPFFTIPGWLLLLVVLLLHLAWVLFEWNAAGLALEIHLAGLFAGWVYAKLVFLPWARRRRDAANSKKASTVGPALDRSDDLLDRVARDGLHSLTREERERLGRG